jgi:hypothetical protein
VSVERLLPFTKALLLIAHGLLPTPVTLSMLMIAYPVM